MQADTRLRYLFGLVPDPVLLRRWCEEAGIASLRSFVDIDLAQAPDGASPRWAVLQEALRAADAVDKAEGAEAAQAHLRAAIEAAAPRIKLDVHTLRQLMPIPTPVDRPELVSAREALTRLGGLAGVRALAEFLGGQNGAPMTSRQVRDRFRNTGGSVRKLGGGYYALKHRTEPTVVEWVAARIAANGPEQVGTVVAAVLEAYPHGDGRSIEAYLHQNPSVLTVRDGAVHLVQGA